MLYNNVMATAASERDETLTDFCRANGIRSLALFGSVGRGEDGPGSDIDLLVEFDPEARPGFLALARLAREVSTLMGRPVDLVPRDGLKAAIRAQILREARPLFPAEEAPRAT